MNLMLSSSSEYCIFKYIFLVAVLQCLHERIALIFVRPFVMMLVRLHKVMPVV